MVQTEWGDKMGNGASSERMDARLFHVMPKRDLANALVAAWEYWHGNKPTTAELLDFINAERSAYKRRAIRFEVQNEEVQVSTC